MAIKIWNLAEIKRIEREILDDGSVALNIISENQISSLINWALKEKQHETQFEAWFLLQRIFDISQSEKLKQISSQQQNQKSDDSSGFNQFYQFIIPQNFLKAIVILAIAQDSEFNIQIFQGILCADLIKSNSFYYLLFFFHFILRNVLQDDELISQQIRQDLTNKEIIEEILKPFEEIDNNPFAQQSHQQKFTQEHTNRLKIILLLLNDGNLLIQEEVRKIINSNMRVQIAKLCVCAGLYQTIGQSSIKIGEKDLKEGYQLKKKDVVNDLQLVKLKQSEEYLNELEGIAFSLTTQYLNPDDFSGDQLVVIVILESINGQEKILNELLEEFMNEKEQNNQERENELEILCQINEKEQVQIRAIKQIENIINNNLDFITQKENLQTSINTEEREYKFIELIRVGIGRQISSLIQKLKKRQLILSKIKEKVQQEDSEEKKEQRRTNSQNRLIEKIEQVIINQKQKGEYIDDVVQKWVDLFDQIIIKRYQQQDSQIKLNQNVLPLGQKDFFHYLRKKEIVQQPYPTNEEQLGTFLGVPNEKSEDLKRQEDLLKGKNANIYYVQNILASKIYKSKSHFEVRLEDYILERKQKGLGQQMIKSNQSNINSQSSQSNTLNAILQQGQNQSNQQNEMNYLYLHFIIFKHILKILLFNGRWSMNAGQQLQLIFKIVGNGRKNNFKVEIDKNDQDFNLEKLLSINCNEIYKQYNMDYLNLIQLELKQYNEANQTQKMKIIKQWQKQKDFVRNLTKKKNQIIKNNVLQIFEEYQIKESYENENYFKFSENRDGRVVWAMMPLLSFIAFHKLKVESQNNDNNTMKELAGITEQYYPPQQLLQLSTKFQPGMKFYFESLQGIVGKISLEIKIIKINELQILQDIYITRLREMIQTLIVHCTLIINQYDVYGTISTFLPFIIKIIQLFIQTKNEQGFITELSQILEIIQLTKVNVGFGNNALNQLNLDNILIDLIEFILSNLVKQIDIQNETKIVNNSDDEARIILSSLNILSNFVKQDSKFKKILYQNGQLFEQVVRIISLKPEQQSGLIISVKFLQLIAKSLNIFNEFLTINCNFIQFAMMNFSFARKFVQCFSRREYQFVKSNQLTKFQQYVNQANTSIILQSISILQKIYNIGQQLSFITLIQKNQISQMLTGLICVSGGKEPEINMTEKGLICLQLVHQTQQQMNASWINNLTKYVTLEEIELEGALEEISSLIYQKRTQDQRRNQPQPLAATLQNILINRK